MSTQLETALEGLNEMTIEQRRAVLGLSESELRIVRNLNGLLGRVEELEAELERLRESSEPTPGERRCRECGKPTRQETGYLYCRVCSEKLTWPGAKTAGDCVGCNTVTIWTCMDGSHPVCWNCEEKHNMEVHTSL